MRAPFDVADVLGRALPDPCYGGREGFDHALELIEHAADGQW
ncbi:MULTISPECIES: hypothetical protein [Halomonadaceae]|nr:MULTISPECIES: hypothetical protein [Halomonas]